MMASEPTPRVIEIFARWEMARDSGEPFDLVVNCETPEEKAAVERLIVELAAPAPTEKRSVPPNTERYRFLSFVARGGMGEVYRAEDLVLNRNVAIKVLRRRLGSSVQSFRAEALLVASLDHPAIVPIYEFGELADGRPFFAMKFVEGETLESKLNRRKWGITELLRDFERICDAVAYAHGLDKPVLHRDLKPQNVMVGEHGMVLVLDWGIAKFVETTASLDGDTTSYAANHTDDETPNFTAGVTPRQETGTGIAKGTPAYMAPEQARGERRRISSRTDVFGLGGILCRMLTGEHPFRADFETWAGTVDEYLETRTFALLDHCGEDGDLVAVAKRCLSPAPEQRFADATEVSAAVRAFLDSQQQRLKDAEIKAATAEAERKAAEADAKANETELRAEQRRRKLSRGLVASLVVLFLVTALGLLVVDSYRRQASQQAAANKSLADANEQLAKEERVAKLEAVEQRILAQERAANILFARGKALAEQGHIGAACAWMERAIELAPASSKIVDPLRYSIAYLLTKTPHLQSLITDADTSYGLIYHHDGKRLFTAGEKGILRSWDPSTGKQLGSDVKLGAPIERLAISPNGATLFCAATNGVVYRRDASRLELAELASWPGHDAPVLAIAISPDGQHVATGGRDGVLLVRESEKGQIVARWSPHGRAGGGPSSKAIRALAFSRDGRELASGGFDGVIHVSAWSKQTSLAKFVDEDERGPIWALSYGEVSGEPSLFSGDFAGRVRAWKRDGKFQTILRRSGAIVFIGPQPNRPRGELLVAAVDPSMAVWSPSGHYDILHPRTLEAAAWSPSGNSLATACSDGVRIWRTNSKMPVHELIPEDLAQDEKYVIGGVDMAATGDRFVMTEMGRKGRVWLWDFSEEKVREVKGPPPFGIGVSAARLSQDGNRALLGRVDGGISCWNIPNKTEEWRTRPHTVNVRSVSISSDNAMWAASYLDGKIQLGRVEGKLEPVISLKNAFACAMAFTPSRRQLIVLESLRKEGKTTDSGAVSWWDTTTGERIGDRQPVDFYPYSLVLSPDGKFAVACGKSAAVASFDVETHNPGPVIQSTGVIQDIAFGHGGNILLTVGTNNVASLWHWPSGQEVGTRFPSGEREGAFTVDGRIVFRSTGLGSVPMIEQTRAPRFVPTREHSLRTTSLSTGLRINAEDRIEAIPAAEWRGLAKKASE